MKKRAKIQYELTPPRNNYIMEGISVSGMVINLINTICVGIYYASIHAPLAMIYSFAFGCLVFIPFACANIIAGSLRREIKKQKAIEKELSELFPQYTFAVIHSPDGAGWSVEVYNIPKEDQEKVSLAIYDMEDLMEDSSYGGMLIPSFHSVEATNKYYPELSLQRGE